MEKQTKKDEISEFCQLMIKINIKTNGSLRIGQIIGKALDKFDIKNDAQYIKNELLLEGLQKEYEN